MIRSHTWLTARRELTLLRYATTDTSTSHFPCPMGVRPSRRPLEKLLSGSQATPNPFAARSPSTSDIPASTARKPCSLLPALSIAESTTLAKCTRQEAALAERGVALDQRRRLDCETTLPASVFVTVDDLGLSSARDALPSVFAPVWAEEPACRSADPASDFCRGLALLL